MREARYDPMVVQPMRDELTQIGSKEPLTPDNVEVLGAEDRTVLMVVNWVCGCAAGKARPGVRLALKHSVRPGRLATVFAGMEIDATERARSHFIGYPPSSPQIALFGDGQLVHMLERQDIEGRSAEVIAGELRGAFDTYCVPAT